MLGSQGLDSRIRRRIGDRPTACALHCRRAVSVVGVSALHIAMLWFASGGLLPPTYPARMNELQLTLIPARLLVAPSIAPAPDFNKTPVLEPRIFEPTFDIIDSAPSNATVRTGTGRVILAPRPDPTHINWLPELPHEFRSVLNNNALTLELRILVLTDGCVGETEITKSSGDSRIDRFLAAYVKANWRYLPSSLDASYINNWTTILIRLTQSQENSVR